MNMQETPDFDRLQAELRSACRQAFRAVRKAHANESFYCFALFTSGEYGYLVPTAMTEEGLLSVVRQYQQEERYASEPEDELRLSLRWSPCDSPLHLEGEEYFNQVNEIMTTVQEALHAIDIDHGWDEFEAFCGLVDEKICSVLEELDREGLFGTGNEREALFLAIMMGDQDDSILQIGKRLNPPRTFAKFAQEWQQIDDMYADP